MGRHPFDLTPEAQASVNTSRTDVLNIQQAARLLKIHPMTLYRLCRAREVPCVKLGGSWRLSRQALVAFLSAKAQDPNNLVGP